MKVLGDQQAVVRNGYLPAREVLTAIGPVEVRVPKMRDRSVPIKTFQHLMLHPPPAGTTNFPAPSYRIRAQQPPHMRPTAPRTHPPVDPNDPAPAGWTCDRSGSSHPRSPAADQFGHSEPARTREPLAPQFPHAVSLPASDFPARCRVPVPVVAPPMQGDIPLPQTRPEALRLRLQSTGPALVAAALTASEEKLVHVLRAPAPISIAHRAIHSISPILKLFMLPIPLDGYG